jgi:REP element-mobilizing transposase RayT
MEDEFEKTIQELVRNFKPKTEKPLKWWMEKNALVWHVVHRLYGKSDHFKYTENFKEYRRSSASASWKTGVLLIDYGVMPTHIHDLVIVPSFEALSSYLRRTDISYSRKRLNMKGRDGMPIQTTPVFDGKPYCTPMGSVRQTYETLRYIHNNPKKWNEKYPDNPVSINEKTGLYWKSSAWQRSNGTHDFSFDGNLLLNMTGKTWPELLELYSMGREDFDKKVKEIEDSMSEAQKNNFLKINPNKKWTMDISGLMVPEDECD